MCQQGFSVLKAIPPLGPTFVDVHIQPALLLASYAQTVLQVGDFESSLEFVLLRHVLYVELLEA
jgi:hypothetical protein